MACNNADIAAVTRRTSLGSSLEKLWHHWPPLLLRTFHPLSSFPHPPPPSIPPPRACRHSSILTASNIHFWDPFSRFYGCCCCCCCCCFTDADIFCSVPVWFLLIVGGKSDLLGTSQWNGPERGPRLGGRRQPKTIQFRINQTCKVTRRNMSNISGMEM